MTQYKRLQLEPWHWWALVLALLVGLGLLLARRDDEPRRLERSRAAPPAVPAADRTGPQPAAQTAPPAQTLIAAVPDEPSVFWCRKMDNRECSPSREQCENGGAREGAECFSTPTAWCFQAGLPPWVEELDQALNDAERTPAEHLAAAQARDRAEQVICVAHREYCEEWRSERKGQKDKQCLQLIPREYPTR